MVDGGGLGKNSREEEQERKGGEENAEEGMSDRDEEDGNRLVHITHNTWNNRQVQVTSIMWEYNQEYMEVSACALTILVS